MDRKYELLEQRLLDLKQQLIDCLKTGKKMKRLIKTSRRENQRLHNKLLRKQEKINKIDKEARNFKRTIRRLNKQNDFCTSDRLPRTLFSDSNKEFDVRLVSAKNDQYFHYRERVYRFNETIDPFEYNDALSFLARIMSRALNQNSLYQLEISNSTRDFSTDRLHFQTKVDLEKEMKEVLLYYELGSTIAYPDINTLTFTLTCFNIPAGKTGRLQIVDTHRKRSIITILPKPICLGKAIICALSIFAKDKLSCIFANNLIASEIEDINFRRHTATNIHKGIFTDLEYDYLRKANDKRLQDILAKALYRITNISIKDSGSNLEDVRDFAEKLSIQITVYTKDKEILYRTATYPIQINLLLDNSHYEVITCVTAMKGIARSREQCKYCSEFRVHTGEKIICDKCSKCFAGNECFSNHIENRCVTHSWRCLKCYRIYKTPVSDASKKIKEGYRSPVEHQCYEMFCRNCRKYYSPNGKPHTCYIMAVKPREPSTLYAFLDFESRTNSNFNHIMNYCVIQTFDDREFVFIENNLPLPSEALRLHKNFYHANNVVEAVCKYILSNFKNYTILAHYGSGYDFLPIFEWFVNNGLKVKPPINGNKILFMNIKFGYNIMFIDSKSLINSPLKKLPDVFGLKHSKGLFPYMFNKPENYTYTGENPDKVFYDYYNKTQSEKEEVELGLKENYFDLIKDLYKYNSMSVKEKSKFDSVPRNFYFPDRIYIYCKLDVEILRKSCLKFRELVMSVSDIDPLQYPSLASLCHADFRFNHLQPNTIIADTTLPTDNHSIKSIKWLNHISARDGIKIRHACNGGEFYIKELKRKVDGYCEATNTVYQFHGCYYHGCLVCFDEKDLMQLKGKSMKHLHTNTMKFDQAIRDLNYNLIICWEHEYDKLVKAGEISEVSNGDSLVDRPKLRSAFYGARTETFKLYYEFDVNNNKVGKYKDFVSMYPAVLFHEEFMLGEPKIISHPKHWCDEWFGLAHVRIRPPKCLYYPVLPYKVNNSKLLFGLCRSCMQKSVEKCKHFENSSLNKELLALARHYCDECYIEKHDYDCAHTDAERDITGFWFTKEIKLAISKGYVIQYVYEVHHFEYRSTELFKPFIRKWLKIKMESSDIYKNCSPAEKHDIESKYREDAEKLGINLDEIIPNSGRRTIAKLFLNAFYGRFGMRLNFTQKSYVRNCEELFDILLNKKLQSLNVKFPNEKLAYCSYKFKDEYIKNNYQTNLYIAILTTSYGRMKLYQVLDALGESILYCDTDSVIYEENEFTRIAMKKFSGTNLGELDDDPALEGGYISLFSSCGPKQVNAKIVTKYGEVKEHKKHKGFQFNSSSESQLTMMNNIDCIKTYVQPSSLEEINNLHNKNKVCQSQFKIKDLIIQSNSNVKQYICSYDKRRINICSEKCISSLPLGY